ncbi:hypothetical protein C1H46_029732 [Malus baccata]|uniref:DUF4408 domain-containing protein n=1 Tax=Malus baccata TaxID=106549 RepID=A0A540LED2_MALBA|nr:hypothetical protein C1H46_029732 [Malus baccata]
MSKLNEKSQILMFSLLVFLLVLAPLLSSSLRTPYLYIITNLLIIALGAQAGVLSSFSKPDSDHDKKNGSGASFSFAPKPVVPTELASDEKRVVTRNDEHQTVVVPQYVEKKARVVEKSKSEKIVDTVKVETQAGVLSSFSKPDSDHDKKNGSGASFSFAPKPVVPTELASDEKRVVTRNDEHQTVVAPQYVEKKARVVEKSKSEKIVDTVKVESVKKCTSMPSLFFIGGGETYHGDHEVIEEKRYIEGEEEEVFEELSGQELFAKAENFISNFYKQLKMQREDSWKKIHEFYHKAF